MLKIRYTKFIEESILIVFNKNCFIIEFEYFIGDFKH